MITSAPPPPAHSGRFLVLGFGTGAVLVWGVLALGVPGAPVVLPPTPTVVASAGPLAQPGAAAPRSVGTSYGGACRSTAHGRLELNPTFGGSDLIQVDYWTPGQPERSVLLPGGAWSRPAGMGGAYWAWVGCTFEQAREQVALSIQRRLADGANQAGWGDPSLFTRMP